jgi:hypothetical protein
MARGVSQRDHPAKRRAEYDRIRNAQDIAERAHVIAPLRQVPAFPRAILASTIASMVEVDHLGNVGQGRIGGSVDRVVGAGATMEKEQGRLFPHGRTVRHQLRALDVEEQSHPVDEHVHGPNLLASKFPCQACQVFSPGLLARFPCEVVIDPIGQAA